MKEDVQKCLVFMKDIVVLIIKISNTIIWLEVTANVGFISVVRHYSGNMMKKCILQTVIERSCTHAHLRIHRYICLLEQREILGNKSEPSILYRRVRDRRFWEKDTRDNDGCKFSKSQPFLVPWFSFSHVAVSYFKSSNLCRKLKQEILFESSFPILYFSLMMCNYFSMTVWNSVHHVTIADYRKLDYSFYFYNEFICLILCWTKNVCLLHTNIFYDNPQIITSVIVCSNYTIY